MKLSIYKAEFLTLTVISKYYVTINEEEARKTVIPVDFQSLRSGVMPTGAKFSGQEHSAEYLT